MPQARIKVVEFLFVRVNKKPSSIQDLNRNAWLKHQRRQIRMWGGERAEIVRTELGITTSAKPAFAKSSDFRRAIDTALGLGADIVVADMRELLSRTDAALIPDSVHRLDAAPVNIWDAARNVAWGSLSKDIRQDVMLKAMAVRMSRSKYIKEGLRKRKVAVKAPPGDGKRLGALANQKKANVKAKRLAEFVNSEMEKLPSGQQLSPSRLANALNDAGITPTRAERWEHNSAKNLLRRLKQLDLIARASV